MALDKHWMEIKDRGNPEYKEGVDMFLKFAFSHPGIGVTIRCPCNKCRNATLKRRAEVRADLLKNGMYKNYTEWHLHGEEVEDLLESDSSSESNDSQNDENTADHDEILKMVHDASFFLNMDSGALKKLNGLGSNEESVPQEQNAEAASFYRLLKDAEQKLYPGSERSKLFFIIELLKVKCEGKWSDESMEDLFEFLKSALPEPAMFPETYNEARKIIKDLSAYASLLQLQFGTSTPPQPPTREGDA